MLGVKEYISAISYSNKQHKAQSLVQNAIKYAIEGKYGTNIIGGSKYAKIKISTLMQQLWLFNLETIARRILYPDTIKTAISVTEVEKIILKYRKTIEKKGPIK